MTQPVQQGTGQQAGQQPPPVGPRYTAGAVGSAIARRCNAAAPAAGEPQSMLFSTPRVQMRRISPDAPLTLVGQVVLDSGQRFGIALVEMS